MLKREEAIETLKEIIEYLEEYGFNEKNDHLVDKLKEVLNFLEG